MSAQRESKIDNFAKRFIDLDSKVLILSFILGIPFGILMMFFVDPWIIEVGGPWRRVYVFLSIPLGSALLLFTVGGITKIIRKR